MRLLHLAAIALLATALYWSLRLAYADELSRSRDPADLARAVHLAPGNAENQLAAGAFERACRLNPWNAEAWIERGLREDSETSLLEAVRVDRTFAPVWTLANYYVRTNQLDKFWPRVTACFLIEEHDPEPVFDLCRRVADRDETIQKALPAKQRPLSRYLQYLIAHQAGLAATSAAYEAMMQTPGPKDPSVLLSYCDYLLARGLSEAVLPWNVATGGRLDPFHGSSLTNGNFAHDPAGRGFDWHIPVQAGIAAGLFRTIPALRLTLDGDENESAELLWQLVPLAAGKRYRLRFRYCTEDIPPESGLRWQVAGLAAGADLSSDSWTENTIEFETPHEISLARLSLRYRRPVGRPRLNGNIRLQRVRLELR